MTSRPRTIDLVFVIGLAALTNFAYFALSLNAIVCQQLVPRTDNSGRAVAVEVLLANHAVRNHIRNEKLQNLISEITVGKRQGMISLEDSLVRLVQQGAITVEDARIRSARQDEFESLMRGTRFGQ